MKLHILVLMFITAMSTAAVAQNRFFTKNGTISFSAGTAVEDVDATNKSVTSVIDITTGQAEFAVLMKGFEFKRSLMQEHFNENYVESDKFPKAVFKGQIQNVSSVSFSKDGKYPVVVKGQLEIHGVKNDIEVPGTISIAAGSVACESDFVVDLAAYHISIPGAVSDKLSPSAKIHVACNYKPL